MIKRLRNRFKGMTWKTWYNIATYSTVKYRHPVWYNVLNRKAKNLYLEHKPTITPVEDKLIQELRANGIAAIPVEQLIGKGKFAPVQKAALDYVKKNKAIIDMMNKSEQELRSGNLEYFKDAKFNFQKFKFFAVRLMGGDRVMGEERMVELDMNEPFLRDVLLNQKVLNVVNGYMGMYARINYMNIWYNLPVDPNSDMRTSQRWHRDPGDLKFVKVFLYVSDVRKDMGPLHYIMGSQHGGKHGRSYPRPMPYGKYPNHDEVEQRFKDDIFVGTGKAGTLVFVDTLGLHRGGFSTTDPRIVYMGMFLSDAGIDPYFVKHKQGEKYDHLSPAAKYALHLDDPAELEKLIVKPVVAKHA